MNDVHKKQCALIIQTFSSQANAPVFEDMDRYNMLGQGEGPLFIPPKKTFYNLET